MRISRPAKYMFGIMQQESVNGECQMSLPDLAARIDEDYTIQAVSHLMKVLIEAGWISIKMKGFKDNPTVYTINRRPIR